MNKIKISKNNIEYISTRIIIFGLLYTVLSHLLFDYFPIKISITNSPDGIKIIARRTDNNTVEIKTYYKDGSLKAELNIKNGLEYGVSKLYFPNGRIDTIYNSKNGKKNGAAISYYESGTLRQKVYLKNDKMSHNLQKYYSNGKIEVKIKTINKNKLIEKIYHKNGNIKEEKTKNTR